MEGIDAGEHQHHDGAGQDEENAGGEAAAGAVQQPADIGRKLLRLRPGEQHAIAERMQETLLADPALLIDQDAVQ